MRRLILFLVPAFLILIVLAFAHPGRTDQYGGHYDKSTGTYHYHNGTYSSTSASSSSSNNTSTVSNYINVYKRQVAKLEEDLKIKDNEISKIKQQLASKDDAIQTLNAEIKELEKLKYLYVVIFVMLLVYIKQHRSMAKLKTKA